MKIQGITLQRGDKFQVGEDSSIYTFIDVTESKRGFLELNCENEFDSISSFRIDTMQVNGLYIKLV